MPIDSMERSRGRRGRPSHHDERPIRGAAGYNLNFIDWDNEFEAVCDHVHKIQSDWYSGEGKTYQEEPYFSVPYAEVRFFFESVEAEDDVGGGLTDTQISALQKWKGNPKQCSICLDASGEGLVLPCGHIFHTTCISRWLRVHPM
jgi:hypothetical protein